MIDGLLERASPESVFVVEADQQFDPALLPNADSCGVDYVPARVGILRV